MSESRLPLVAPHRKEHTYCAYCPKMCRFSCPVSTVQGRESTTPWGKMTSVHHVAEGRTPLSLALASTWSACTGCMRCKTYCAHENDVPATLRMARAEAVREGLAPEAVYDIIRLHADREQRAVRAARQLFGKVHVSSDRPTAFVPGCTSVVVAPEATQRVFALLGRIRPGRTRVAASSCCGLPLLEAGDVDGFLSSARRFFDSLRGAHEAVFLDPGCLHALKVLAPRFGVEAPIPLLHLSEVVAASNLPFRRPALAEPVRYHDACRLGRGLGIYDEPRLVLERVLGRRPAEFAQSRAHAECSGAGGALPRTDPETADGIARDREREHLAAGGGTLVTACPASAHRWKRLGVPALEFGELVAGAAAEER